MSLLRVIAPRYDLNALCVENYWRQKAYREFFGTYDVTFHTPEEIESPAFTKPADGKWLVDAAVKTLSRETLKSLGVSVGPLTEETSGSVLLFLKAQKLSSSRESFLFVPGSSNLPNTLKTTELRTLADKLFQDEAWCLAVNDPRALELVTALGIRTSAYLRFPLIQLAALASASGILTNRPDVLWTALSLNVPAIGVGEETRQVCAATTQPHVSLQEISGPQGTREVRRRLSSIDLPALRERGEYLRESFNEAMRALLPRPRRQRSTAETATDSELVYCALSDHNNLSFMLGLIENLRQVAGEKARLVLLLSDPESHQLVRRAFPSHNLHLLSLHDLFPAQELADWKDAHPSILLKVCKPRLLLYTLREFSKPTLYVDTDIHFFDEPKKILDLLKTGKAPVVLFSHFNMPQLNKYNGCYNSGLVGVRPGAETFLTLWGDCLNMKASRKSSIFAVDQPSLNVTACLLPRDVTPYPYIDENIGPWNSEALGAKWGPERPVLESGTLVNSVHCSGPDPMQITPIKLAWDQVITSLHTRDSNVFRDKSLRVLFLLQASTSPRTIRFWDNWVSISQRKKNKELPGAIHLPKGYGWLLNDLFAKVRGFVVRVIRRNEAPRIVFTQKEYEEWRQLVASLPQRHPHSDAPPTRELKVL